MKGKGKVIGWGTVFLMWIIFNSAIRYCCNSSEVNNNSSEIINSAEDMIEWIIEDEASGNVGREQADTYIDNLEQMIKETR